MVVYLSRCKPTQTQAQPYSMCRPLQDAKQCHPGGHHRVGGGGTWDNQTNTILTPRPPNYPNPRHNVQPGRDIRSTFCASMVWYAATWAAQGSQVRADPAVQEGLPDPSIRINCCTNPLQIQPEQRGRSTNWKMHSSYSVMILLVLDYTLYSLSLE